MLSGGNENNVKTFPWFFGNPSIDVQLPRFEQSRQFLFAKLRILQRVLIGVDAPMLRRCKIRGLQVCLLKQCAFQIHFVEADPLNSSFCEIYILCIALFKLYASGPTHEMMML